MKRSAKTVLVVVPLLMALGLGLLGGFHHQAFTRYTSSVTRAATSDSDFILAVHPEFTSGGTRGLETVIPFLLFRQREHTSAPHIFLSLPPHSSVYGYEGKTSLSLTALTVQDAAGRTFPLITSPAIQKFNIIGTGFGSRREDLGAVEGDSLTITASGFVLTASGERQPFTFHDSWTVTHSSRFDLGILLSE
jgi:hypothetical protein